MVETNIKEESVKKYIKESKIRRRLNKKRPTNILVSPF